MEAARAIHRKDSEINTDHASPFICDRLDVDPTLSTTCDNRGAPVEPKRYSDFDLVEREASYGRTGFAMQFMLNTSICNADQDPAEAFGWHTRMDAALRDWLKDLSLTH